MRKTAYRWTRALGLIGAFVLVLWIVEIINYLLGYRLNIYGIQPRQPDGLPGIFFWVFLHANISHLVMNTTPLIVMGYFVALRGTRTFILASLFILVFAGTGVWLFGRDAIHIGASGLIFGYFGLLVSLAFYEQRLKTFLIASAMLLLYGGILLGALPQAGFISWEGHLFGLISGFAAARLFAWKQ